ncbi:MAG: hypothetical protein IPJ81_15060 [Chitinophagaceae bacterium]|nr:hypothetical protein [Chitinophagaceae bacterium]
MKKNTFTILTILASFVCFSQAYINGATQVQPNAFENYIVSFKTPFSPNSSVKWNISGGGFSSIIPIYVGDPIPVPALKGEPPAVEAMLLNRTIIFLKTEIKIFKDIVLM